MVRPVSYAGPSQHKTTSSITSASSIGSVFFLPQYIQVSDPSYISLDAANAIISSYPPPEATANLISKDVTVTPGGLRIVNLFLDYMLHEFLARARATTLSRLREAVSVVIRTSLGTAAMVEAEQELAAYLHDSDQELYAYDEEGEDNLATPVPFNLEKVWSRSRIKCMVYSTLGDKEEDDFGDDTEEEGDYDIPASKRRLSPAGAIYLTAVLEFIGEHCFLVSARTAYQRLAAQLRGQNVVEPVPFVIDETDVRRGIAEDDLTTRIWRKWKRSEKILSTIGNTSGHRHGDRRESRVGSDTFNRLPFTSGQTLSVHDARRNSIMSAPDMSRGDSSTSIDSKTRSLPPNSPTQTSHKRKSRRYSKMNNYAHDSLHQSESMINIKETLGERGVMLPDSPRESNSPPFEQLPRASTSTSRSAKRLSDLDEEIYGSPRPRNHRVREQKKPEAPAESQDTVTTPSHESSEDPLRTPTLKDDKQFFAGPGTKGAEEEDAVVMGGEAGLDYSIWETKPPVDQRFYFSPNDTKHASIKSNGTIGSTSMAHEPTQPLNVAKAATPEPALSHEVPQAKPAASKFVPSDPVRDLQISRAPKSRKTNEDEEEELLPGSWPKDGVPISNNLAVPHEESDASSTRSNHVNDRIARQMKELERQHRPAPVGLGLSQSTISNPPQNASYVVHPELTPILESSPRDSMNVEADSDFVISPRLQSSRTRNSDERSPPPTRHSNHSAKIPMSPTFSTHSDKCRTSSLTSQAERLRSKFLNRGGANGELTVDTVAADPTKMDRRMKFEHLIRSGETMKMTLTPTSLRSIEDDQPWGENRTIPERVRQQAKENSTRELADFLRHTGPESYHGATTERRGSVPDIDRNVPNTNGKVPMPEQSARSMPSTPVIRSRIPANVQPGPSSPKHVARAPVNRDPDHTTLQLAAFIRTTGPDTDGVPKAPAIAPIIAPTIAPTIEPPITLSTKNMAKPSTNSIHSTGDSSTSGLLKHQHLQRYPPSPSTSTQYGTLVDDYEEEDSDDDYELSLYPGARRKNKSAPPKEESLVDFLRNTAPPEPALPPSPATPKAFKENYTNGTKKKSYSNIKSHEPPPPRAVDIFAATNPSRVMSPIPAAQPAVHPKSSLRPSQHTSDRSFPQPLKVNLPSPRLMPHDDFFSPQRTQSVASRQSSVRYYNDPDEIQSIRTTRTQPRYASSTARDPVSVRSPTTDSLADFLRNTGPADFGAPNPKLVKKSKSGFFKRLLGSNNASEKNGRLSRSGSVSTTTGRFTPIVIPASVRNY